MSCGMGKILGCLCNGLSLGNRRRAGRKCNLLHTAITGECESKRPCGAACPQNQDAPVRRDTAAFNRQNTARAVGGIAFHASVLHFDRIHRAKRSSSWVNFIEKRQDGFFVRNGDVKSCIFFQPRNPLLQILRRNVEYIIGKRKSAHGEQLLVDKRGHRVPDWMADDGKLRVIHGQNSLSGFNLRVKTAESKFFYKNILTKNRAVHTMNTQSRLVQKL